MLVVAALATFSFSACSVETNEQPGGTNIQDMAGFWDVTAYTVGSNNQLTQFTDVFSMETYNTAANKTDSMWINDLGNLWAFKFKTPINYTAKTFSCGATNYDVTQPGIGNAVMTDGQILLGKGHNIHGLPCDSIAFKIKFSDDNKNRTFFVTGVRHFRIH